MAVGWARDGAVQEQIGASVKDAVAQARKNLPCGESKKHIAKQKSNIANKHTIMSAVEVSPLAKMIISDNLIQKNQRILSLGSGIGIDEEYFVNNADVDVLGTDSEEDIIEQAKIREKNRLKFIKLDVTLPFAFETPFECVYTRNLLHYFNSAEQQFILEQISSVLIPGGLLVLQLKSKDDIFYTGKHYKKVIQIYCLAFNSIVQ